MITPTLTAIHHTRTTIDITLSKSFYQGLSDVFYLLNAQHELVKLAILSQVEHSDVFAYVVQCPKLDLQQDYWIYDAHMLRTPLEWGRVVRDADFDHEYAYLGTDLGATYTPSHTTFVVWAPTASSVNLIIAPSTPHQRVVMMEKGERGTYRLQLAGDYDGVAYRYAIRRHGIWTEANDPYALSSLPNHLASVVISLQRLPALPEVTLPEFKHPTDAVLYELHVRDFSMDPYAPFQHRGKYAAFREDVKSPKGTSLGLDYIASLGITHVQLLPIYDYGSVDELHPEVAYNWGYDPMQFGIPEGSYALDPLDPYSRIIDTRDMIVAIHQKGLRMVMDVVYNHMFDAPTSDFEKLVPYYYFRYGEHGEVSNGSFCGNDLDSTRAMTRKYFLDMIRRWVTLYRIDGMRFDLMGIIDDETMRQIDHMCRQLVPNFIIYGEGWNMPTFLPDGRKTTQQNAARVPHIGFFSDKFRELIKGSTWDTEIAQRGYATGAAVDMTAVKDVLTGSCTGKYGAPTYVAPTQTINYVECHDNMTLADKIAVSNASETEEQRMKRQRLVTALVILAQGVPFLHAGQEWLRTKHGAHNTFRSSDLVNRLDWKRMEQHLAVVDYIRDVIRIRRQLPELRLHTTERLQKDVTFKDLPQNGLAMTIRTPDHPHYEALVLIVNPSPKVLLHNLEDYHLVLLNEAGAPRVELHAKNLMVNPISLILLAEPRLQR